MRKAALAWRDPAMVHDDEDGHVAELIADLWHAFCQGDR